MLCFHRTRRIILGVLRARPFLVAIRREPWRHRISPMFLHICLLHVLVGPWRHSYGMAVLLEMLLALVLWWHLLWHLLL